MNLDIINRNKNTNVIQTIFLHKKKRTLGIVDLQEYTNSSKSTHGTPAEPWYKITGTVHTGSFNTPIQ